MITLSLIAAGLSALVFLLAVRGSGDGYEDELGYHADLKVLPIPRHAARARQVARAGVYTVPRASPWLRLPVHGQDEIDLWESCTVVRLNRRSPILD